MHGSRTEERQTVIRSDPQDAIGVRQKAVHVAGRQSVFTCIGSQVSFRKLIESVGRTKPHSSVGALGDRRDAVRNQTIRHGVGREAPLLEPAEPGA